MMEERQSFEKVRHMRHIKITQNPKPKGEQRSLGFGPRQFARNEGWKMVENCEETIALEESMENIRKLEETVGKMRTLQKGNAGKTFEKARHIETTKKPKLNGEQRPLGFGPRQFARGRAALPRNECWKMVESCEETIALEETVS